MVSVAGDSAVTGGTGELAGVAALQSASAPEPERQLATGVAWVDVPPGLRDNRFRVGWLQRTLNVPGPTSAA